MVRHKPPCAATGRRGGGEAGPRCRAAHALAAPPAPFVAAAFPAHVGYPWLWFLQDLGRCAYGNPHSITPSSLRASRAVEAVRRRLLDLFDADPAQYEVRCCAAEVGCFVEVFLPGAPAPRACAVAPLALAPHPPLPCPSPQLVFTRSATGALQLIGEMFPWGPASQYAYLRSNHKSVLGALGRWAQACRPVGAQPARRCPKEVPGSLAHRHARVLSFSLPSAALPSLLARHTRIRKAARRRAGLPDGVGGGGLAGQRGDAGEGVGLHAALGAAGAAAAAAVAAAA